MGFGVPQLSFMLQKVKCVTRVESGLHVKTEYIIEMLCPSVLGKCTEAYFSNNDQTKACIQALPLGRDHITSRHIFSKRKL